MIGWLWRMLVGRFTEPPSCEHVWETKTTYECNRTYGNQSSDYTKKHMNCTKCGEWKSVRL